MAFDGLALAAVCRELADRLTGGRVNKIYQPEKEEIILHIRAPGRRQSAGSCSPEDSRVPGEGCSLENSHDPVKSCSLEDSHGPGDTAGQNLRLVISAHAQRARIHLTAGRKDNPQAPPMFCMLLRKYLEGGRLIRVEQPGLERICRLYFEVYDELGRQSEKALVVEIMGKHSNIILLDPAANTILDGIKRYTHATSRYREVLPGREYIAPPSQGKHPPGKLDLDTFQELLLGEPEDTPVVKALLRHIDGLSPESCREVLFLADLSEDLPIDSCGQYEYGRLWQVLRGIGEMAETGRFTPALVRDSFGKAVAFSALDLRQFGNLPKEHGTMNDILETYYTERRLAETIGQKKHHLEQVVAGELNRLEKKLSVQDDVLAQAAEAETYRLYGELLTANMFRLEKGMASVSLPNYHDPRQGEITIPLDLRFTPSQQVQHYFRRYHKAKTGARLAAEYRESILEELRYLESVRTELDQAASIQDLAEIKVELGEEGYIKRYSSPGEPGKGGIIRKTGRQGSGKSGAGGKSGFKGQPGVKGKFNAKGKSGAKEKAGVPQELSQPLQFTVFGGYLVLVGKNNRQNDRLTLKTARPEDLWFHVKDQPGSHVILSCHGKDSPPERAVLEAAQLAAWHSRARNSGQVPVDYTQRRHVHKPRGAKPGMVIYEQQRTLYITPDETLVQQLAGQAAPEP